MKISIITVLNTINYGSVLQTYATQKYLSDMGFDTEFVDFSRKDQKYGQIVKKTIFSKRNNLKQMIKKPIKDALDIISLGKSYRVFRGFLNRNIKMSKISYGSFEELVVNPPLADIYCTGSDQTWNSGWYGRVLKSYFLTFCPNRVKKISYAASFGKTFLEDSEKEEIREYLLRYTAISLREESGVKILKELGVSGAVRVLDPTLQLSAAFWHKYIRKPSEEHYVLVYQLNKHPWFNEYAELFAKQKGLKLVRFGANVHQIFKSGKLLLLPEPFQFPSYIAFADYVITDSFHATAFSLNLNTTPICIYPSDYFGRIDDILKLTNLERLHVTDSKDWSVIDSNPIDCEEVNAILEKYRRIGDDFLHKAIE